MISYYKIFFYLGGRGNLHFLTSVDRRPSKIRIEGFDSDDKVAIS